ncbi:MAG TPA: DUF423 domain-containing protein [Sphingomonadaceae bacterium]|nr:DUF423 domain-containing protein [Sphingomonadaceae bacterium]
MKKGGNAIMALAALSGAVAVAAGAFAAHGTSGRAAEWLRTGGSYQLVHAVAAIAVLQAAKARIVPWLFVLGSALFAGTLYAMAFGAPRWLGAVTPIGGIAMIAGWLWLAAGALRR